MKAKWGVAILLAIPAVVAGYLAWLLWRAKEDGRWLFAVFAAFFLVASVAPFFPASRRQETKEVAGTRLAGAWVLPFYLLLFGGLLILAAVVGVFRHHLK
jgi:hypothetical protein